MPKRYWFWALREAVIRMNLLPCRPATPGTSTDSELGEFEDFPPDTSEAARRIGVTTLRFDSDPDPSAFRGATPSDPQLTTPFELYYGVRPDYRTLFRWGCLGYYRRVRDSSGARTNFDLQSSVGIALGRSNHTNGMIFWDPVTQRMNVSADYRLDSDAAIGTHFPNVIYDGQISPLVLRGGNQSSKEPFPPGSPVQIDIDGDFILGNIAAVPIGPEMPHYQVTFPDSPDLLEVPPARISAPDEPVFTRSAPVEPEDATTNLILPTMPDWIKDDTHVTLLADGTRRRGTIQNSDSGWQFQQVTSSGRTTFRYDLADLPVTWQDRLTEGSLELGWQTPERAFHVSAKGITQGIPRSFVSSMKPDNPDRKIWVESYNEESNGLKEQDTYSVITAQEYKDKYSAYQILPTMCVQTIKKDEEGVPVRAKSRIVALGNHEDRIWEKSEKFAPVLRDESARLMTSMAVQYGRIEKQGDCKNAFCQSYLPEGETIILRPPKGAPLTKLGDLWLLRKTLYGLRRSPYHWYQSIKKILLNMGLAQSPHDPCVFYGKLQDDLPPIYIGLYVDDFKYFSLSDEVEALFEKRLSTKCRVDFMGEVSWFLGSKYEWERLPDGRLTVSITQTAKSEDILETHGMTNCNPIASPYRTGFPIDRIPHDGVPIESKTALVKKFQSLVGGILWLQRHTRPDLSTAVSLLSSHSHNPSAGHYEAGKRVLAYIKGTLDRGIRFTQGGQPIDATFSFPMEDGAYTDANWGPQDASHPLAGQTVTLEEVKSLLGHVVFRIGGPICWGCTREKDTVSRSSCESEIYSADEGTKSVLTIRHLLQDLGQSDGYKPTPLRNDNRGCVDWTKGCTVSRKLRHINMRELAVRAAQLNKDISVEHIEGKLNIADLFTKEMKDTAHFHDLALTITSPRRISEILSPIEKTVSSLPMSTSGLDIPLSHPAASAALATEGGIGSNKVSLAVRELTRLLAVPGVRAHLILMARARSTPNGDRQTSIAETILTTMPIAAA
jgi:hypothetical protein